MPEQIGPVIEVLVLFGLALAFALSMWRASRRPDNPNADDKAPGDTSASASGDSVLGGGDFRGGD
jgi:hypothetical protein